MPRSLVSTSTDASAPRAAVLRHLIDLGERAALQGTANMAAAEGARLMAYACRSRSRIDQIRLDAPWMVFVLEGVKHVDMGPSHIVRAGEALLLPRGSVLGVTNVPDADSRCYRALAVEILGDAHALLRRHHPDLALETSSWLTGRPRTLRAGLTALQALAHFCETLLEGSAHPRILDHRLEGLLLALWVDEEVPKAQVVRAHAGTDIVRALRHLVREQPDAAWPAAEVARRLGVSAATLRRRLGGSGTTLRAILLEERMRLARVLLGDRRLGIAEIARRCGYASAGKFARQFARKYGMPPSTGR